MTIVDVVVVEFAEEGAEGVILKVVIVVVAVSIIELVVETMQMCHNYRRTKINRFSSSSKSRSREVISSICKESISS